MARIGIAALLLISFSGVGMGADRYIPNGAAMHTHLAQAGMGGVTTMIYTNSHTLFYNPALLNRQKFSLEITPAQFALGDDILNIVSWAADNADSLGMMQDLTPETQAQILKDAEKFDDKWTGFGISPYVGLAFKHIGIGIYGTVRPELKIDEGVAVPALGIRGYSDMVVGVGYGQMINVRGTDYEVGATVRVINRTQIAPKRVSASDVGNVTDLASTATDELQDTKSGFGLDVGLVRDYDVGSRKVTGALVVQDLYGSLDGYIPPNVKVGALYPVIGGEDANPLLKRWDVAMEFTDLLNRQGISFFSRINMGTELNTLAGLLKLRGGFHQGYPTFGAGINLLFIKLDYAYFTEEQGTAPGQLPSTTHNVQLSFGW